MSVESAIAYITRMREDKDFHRQINEASEDEAAAGRSSAPTATILPRKNSTKPRTRSTRSSASRRCSFATCCS